MTAVDVTVDQVRTCATGVAVLHPHAGSVPLGPLIVELDMNDPRHEVP